MLFNGSTDQFRQFVPVTVNYTLDSLLPTLTATEATLLPRFLGTAVTATLLELATSNRDDLTATEARALLLTRTAVAQIAFAAYLPFAEVQIGADGITVSASDDRKAAFQYQTDKIGQQLLDTGWRAVDELIRLVATNETLFPGWPDSPYYAEHQGALFKTPAEFSRYYPIQDRWLTFWALRPFIRAVEDDPGSDLLARIDALPNTLTAEARAGLKRKLLRALAYQAVLNALPNLSVELNGVNLQVNYSSQYGATHYYQAPSEKQLTWVLDNLQRQADIAWQTLNDALSRAETPLPATPTTGAAGGLYSNGGFTLS